MTIALATRIARKPGRSPFLAGCDVHTAAGYGGSVCAHVPLACSGCATSVLGTAPCVTARRARDGFVLVDRYADGRDGRYSNADRAWFERRGNRRGGAARTTMHAELLRTRREFEQRIVI